MNTDQKMFDMLESLLQKSGQRKTNLEFRTGGEGRFTPAGPN